MISVSYIPCLMYLLATLSISVWVSRHKEQSTSLENYFIGNRRLGSVFLAMTLVATYLSASTFIGGPGAAYTFGLGWVLLALIQLPTLWLTLGVVGHKIARAGKKLNALTLNDLIWARYQSKGLLVLCVLTLLFAFFAMIVVQFIGGARLLETVADIPYHQGFTFVCRYYLDLYCFWWFSCCCLDRCFARQHYVVRHSGLARRSVAHRWWFCADVATVRSDRL